MKGILSVFDNDAKRIKYLMLLFLIIYHLALLYSIKNQHVMLSDSYEYKQAAENFVSDQNFYSGDSDSYKDFRMYTKRTPFYPLIISLFIKLNFHINFIYILQVFLGLFNLFLGLILLKKLMASYSMSIYFFAAFILFTPSQFIYSQFIMADLWLQTFVMLCSICIWYYYQTKHTFWLTGLIFFSIIAALIKPVFLIATFVISIWTLIQLIKIKANKWVFIIAIFPIFNWFLLSNQNKKLTGVFHYSSIGYINLLNYNTSIFLTKKLGKSEMEKRLGSLMIQPKSKAEFIKNYENVNTICRNEILNHSISYGLFHLKGMIYFFMDPGRFDWYSFFRLDSDNNEGFLHSNAHKNKLKQLFELNPKSTIFLFIILLINGLKTLGFFGFIWLNKRNSSTLLLAGIVFYIAFLTGPLGASRFALPVQLIIIAFASVFYARLYTGKLKL